MTPFASKAQARYMFAKKPKIAQEYAAHTSDMKDLPDRVESQKKALAARRKKQEKRNGR